MGHVSHPPCRPGGRQATAAQAAVKAAQPAINTIEDQVRATGTDPEALNTAAVNELRQLVTGAGSNADEARQQAAQALAQARKIPRPFPLAT